MKSVSVFISNLQHHRLELFHSDPIMRGRIDLINHVLDLGLSESLTLALENLHQILSGDEARVIDVEVMESKLML